MYQHGKIDKTIVHNDIKNLHEKMNSSFELQ